MANFLLAGGGTGGHIYPGFAVAEALADLDPSARIDFACTTRPIDKMILEPWHGEKIVQPIQPFSLRPIGFLKFNLAWWQTKKQIREWLKKNEIAAVLGLGGFGSGAAVYEASKLGLRTAFLNPDYVPGRANQWLSKYSNKIFVQWSGTQEYFNRPVEVVGVPLRKSICSLAGSGRTVLKTHGLQEFGLSPDKKTLVITGGSTGARSLNEAVVKVITDLADQMASGWQVLHITGNSDFDRTREAYSSVKNLITVQTPIVPRSACPTVLLGHGWASQPWHNGGEAERLQNLFVKILPYSNRMDLAWAVADLAICRAGAITLAELTTAGIPAILLPYPFHRDNHQAKNANVLVQAGAAIMVDDDKIAGLQTVEQLKQAVQNIVFDDSQRLNMVKGAKTLQQVDAAEKVSRWMIGK
ncbi:MAG: UDP-N-acetylglucosamine--N-acetylmuramyl-(pentapeptide) pyrophosphoryl-undecaprenol N-acetylglucosamine transferase [Phycisphaerae bacterium]